MKRIKLTVAYDGTNYSGFQIQNNASTIEGELKKCLTALLQEEVELIGASRTDAGVHALGNVAVFDTDTRIPAEKISYALNVRLPEDIQMCIRDSPKCIILDEPTAMLDPNGRKEVIRTIRALNQVEDVTVLLITHYMEEVVYADKVVVMDEGKIVMRGTPREIFSRVDELKQYRLDVPQVTLLAHELKKEGIPLPDGILSIDELVNALCQS